MSKKTSYGTLPVEFIVVDEPKLQLPTVTIGCWASLKNKLKSLVKTVVTPPEESRPRRSTAFSDWTYSESDDELLRWSLSDFTDGKYERSCSNVFRMAPYSS